MAALTTAFSTGTIVASTEPLSETDNHKRCGFAGLVDINVNINLDSGMCHGELSKHLGLRLVDIKVNFNNVDIGAIFGQTQKPNPVTNTGKVANIAEGELDPNGGTGDPEDVKGDPIENSEVTPYGIFKENYEGGKKNIFEALEKFTGSTLDAYDVYTSIIFGKDFGGNGILIKNTVAREATEGKYDDKLVFLKNLLTGFFPVWQQDEGAEPQIDISSKNIENVLQHIAGTLGITFFSVVEQHPVEQPIDELVDKLVKEKVATAKKPVQKKEKKAAKKKETKKKVQFIDYPELEDTSDCFEYR